jgi:hypothetical protein
MAQIEEEMGVPGSEAFVRFIKGVMSTAEAKS